jgi:hypothetical protein
MFVGRAGSAMTRAVKDERRRPLRIRGGEECAHLAAVARAEERRLLGADGVENRTHVLHLRLQSRRRPRAIRRSDPALVEQNQPGEWREAQAEVSKHRQVPSEDHADGEGNEHQVPRAFANNVVRDGHITAACVTDFRLLHAASLSVSRLSRKPGTAPSSL